MLAVSRSPNVTDHDEVRRLAHMEAKTAGNVMPISGFTCTDFMPAL